MSSPRLSGKRGRADEATAVTTSDDASVPAEDSSCCPKRLRGAGTTATARKVGTRQPPAPANRPSRASTRLYARANGEEVVTAVDKLSRAERRNLGDHLTAPDRKS